MSKEILEKLTRESNQRIEASSEFAEVYQRLEEVRKNAGVIRPADLVERREEKREKSKDSEPPPGEIGDEETDADGGDQEADDAEEISPQLAEATNVLVDLIAANQLSRSTAKNRAGRNR